MPPTPFGEKKGFAEMRGGAIKKAMGGPPEPPLPDDEGPGIAIEIEAGPVDEMEKNPAVERLIGEPVAPEREGEVKWMPLDKTYTLTGPNGKGLVVREVGILGETEGEEPMENEAEEEPLTPDMLPNRRAEAISKAFASKSTEGKE